MLNNLKDLSICIPYRPIDDRREEIFNWILERYQTIFNGAEVVVSDSSHLAFNRSEARNNAVKESTKDFLYFADADTITQPDQIAEALDFVQGNPDKWVVTQATYYLSTNKTTNHILSQSPDSVEDFRESEMIDTFRNCASIAGGYLVSREQYDRVKGFDERFTGWGFEDNAFLASVNTMFSPATRFPDSYVIHLEHPAMRYDNPFLQYNQSLFSLYENAYLDRDSMSRLLESR